jgi:hypothetical protein
MRPLPAFARAVQRRLLAQPSITARPVCGACSREVDPQDFGRAFCTACEAERARVSEEWDRQRDQDVGLNYHRPAPEHPALDSAAPFLPDEED